MFNAKARIIQVRLRQSCNVSIDMKRFTEIAASVRLSLDIFLRVVEHYVHVASKHFALHFVVLRRVPVTLPGDCNAFAFE